MLRATQDRRYAFTLLAIAVAVLAVGILLRPAQTKAKQQQPPVDLERLQQLTQQRRLRDLSTYLTNAANGVAASLVYLPDTQSSGVVWESRDDVLAPRHAAVPFALIAAKDSADMLPAYRAPAPPSVGEWVLAVARNREDGIVFAHGLYQGRAPARCGSFEYDEVQSSAPLSRSLLGGGLFTIQGQLVGFIASCGDRPTVIATSSVAGFLSRPVTLNDRLESAYGMRIIPSDAQVQVVAVWDHSAADAAGLHPGDIVKAVDGTNIISTEDLQGLAQHPDREHQIVVKRGRRSATLQLTPVEPSPAPLHTLSGLTLGLAGNGREVTVSAVAKDSAAQQAGILPGDVLRRVGGIAALDPLAAAKALNDASAHSVILQLERDGKELEVLLAP